MVLQKDGHLIIQGIVTSILGQNFFFTTGL